MEDWQRQQKLLQARTRLADLEARFGARLDALSEPEYRSIRTRANLVPIQLNIAITNRKAPIVRLELLKAMEAIECDSHPESRSSQGPIHQPSIDRFDVDFADMY